MYYVFVFNTLKFSMRNASFLRRIFVETCLILNILGANIFCSYHRLVFIAILNIKITLNRHKYNNSGTLGSHIAI